MKTVRPPAMNGWAVFCRSSDQAKMRYRARPWAFVAVQAVSQVKQALLRGLFEPFSREALHSGQDALDHLLAQVPSTSEFSQVEDEDTSFVVDEREEQHRRLQDIELFDDLVGVLSLGNEEEVSVGCERPCEGARKQCEIWWHGTVSLRGVVGLPSLVNAAALLLEGHGDRDRDPVAHRAGTGSS